MERQRWLWNPQLEGDIPVAETEKVYGPVMLIYTRYFDIRSRVLTQDQHMPSYSTDDGANINIMRIYTENRAELGGNYGRVLQFEIHNNKWVNVRPDRHLTNIDIQIFDEWNELLVLPTSNGDNQGQNFFWMLDMILEL